MPLVNTLQISQDLGRNAPPQPVAQMDMFKMAGSTAALADLGLVPPEGGMEKQAWGALLSAAGRGLLAGGKWLGSKLWSGAGAATKAVASPVGKAGNKAVEWAGTRLGATPQTIKKIQGLGKGMATEAVGFGALGGGIEAAMAEPGQRGQAFLRGFGSGALGGLAFRGAGNLATAGLRKGLGAGAGGAARLKRLDALKDQPWLGGKMPFTQRMKGWGAKAMMGGVPFAAGMAASMYTPHFGGPAQQPQSPYAQYGVPAARLGAGVTMSRMMGAFPRSPGYNPNLPLPQGGY